MTSQQQKVLCYCGRCGSELPAIPGSTCPGCEEQKLERHWARHTYIVDVGKPRGQRVDVIHSKIIVPGYYCSTHQIREWGYLSKWSLLKALQEGWGGFLASFDDLPPKQAQAYLQEQGFSNLSAFLGHVCAWWVETLSVASLIDAGKFEQHILYTTEEVNRKNSLTIRRYEKRDESELREYFTWLQFPLQLLIHRVCDHDPHSELSRQGLYNKQLYLWILNSVVEHYQDHRPPNGIHIQHVVEG